MRSPFRAAAADLRPQANIYHGAEGGRLNYDWVMSRVSADLPLRLDLQILRDRARELVVNNTSAAAVPKIFGENVVGKDGILMQPKVVTSRDELHDTVNSRIADWWEAFCEYPTADGRGSMVELQRLIMETEITDGEVLVHLIDGFDNPFGFAVDVIDADQLDQFLNVSPTSGQNAIRMGVEQDKWGRPVQYHMWSAHPSEPEGRERITVDAENIIHHYIQQRPRQSRGVTLFAPAIIDLKMLGGYREAELVAARTSAAKMGFLQQQSTDGAPPVTPKEGKKTVNWKANPGTIERLPPGLVFQEWDPKHPTTAFDHFDKAILRSIASALRVSYISMSGDLNNTSFGSGRIGMLNERLVFQALQRRMVRCVLTRIYRRALRMSLLTGALQLPSMDPTRYYDVEWHPRAFPWIDPVKDISEKEHLLAMGATSIQRICKEIGVDWKQVFKERQEEIEYAEELGVPLIISTGQSNKGVNVDTVEESEQDEGDGASDETPNGKTDDSETEDDQQAPPQKRAPAPKAAVRLLSGGTR